MHILSLSVQISFGRANATMPPLLAIQRRAPDSLPLPSYPTRPLSPTPPQPSVRLAEISLVGSQPPPRRSPSMRPTLLTTPSLFALSHPTARAYLYPANLDMITSTSNPCTFPPYQTKTQTASSRIQPTTSSRTKSVRLRPTR